LDRDQNNQPSADEGEMEAIVVTDSSAKLASDAAIRLDSAEKRLLAKMPLHAITSVHGEAGLRERLLVEIAQFPAADRARADGLVSTTSVGLSSTRSGP
jgi:hypothetical protein